MPNALRSLTQSPVFFLMCLHFINWLGFAGWNALLHNFTVERGGFSWADSGLTQTIREVPGFLAFTAIFWLFLMREQALAYGSLVILGIGVALTGFHPTLTGVLLTTFVMSVGFHYFEAMNTSLQLQILSKAEAPRQMGKIASAGAAAQVVAYGGLALVWWVGFRHYETLYLVVGGSCVALTALAWSVFGRFQGPVPQRKEIVLRRRYWLYYALTFMSGARRQLFFAFGGFLLVKKFGYSVADMAVLMLITAAANAVLAQSLGRLVGAWGERATITLENVVLIAVFVGYALTESALVAGLLFVIDGTFFTLILAQKTYFQKIADPADMAATASVAFTINHIAAVAIPVTFGHIGMTNPALIFWLGAVIATMSLTLSFLIPRHPTVGQETTLGAERRPAPAE